MKNICITFDLDWAPDYMWAGLIEWLKDANVKATWFVTHETPLLNVLRQDPQLFELGIHPDFAGGSTHGAVPSQILDKCLQIVPEAVSMRSHGQMQWTGLYIDVMESTPIKFDSSFYLRDAKNVDVSGFCWKGEKLARVHYIWEDDLEMMRDQPAWDVDLMEGQMNGVAVFDFHPVHVYLNRPTPDTYERLKNEAGAVDRIPEDQARNCVGTEGGPKTMLDSLIVEASRLNCSKKISELAT